MTTDIIVNGRVHSVASTTVSYDEAVALAGLPSHRIYTVVVAYPEREHRDRTLTPGQSAPITSRLLINVGDTSRA